MMQVSTSVVELDEEVVGVDVVTGVEDESVVTVEVATSLEEPEGVDDGGTVTVTGVVLVRFNVLVIGVLELV